MSQDPGENVKVQFVPVGRHRREWMWKVRDGSDTITISGQRFDSLSDAVRDVRTQFLGLADEPNPDEAAIAEFHRAARRRKAVIFAIAGVVALLGGLGAIVLSLIAGNETGDGAVPGAGSETPSNGRYGR